MTPQESGRLGGRATAERHGKEHMARIGAAGYRTTVQRHFAGDGIKCQNWLGKTPGVPRLNKAQHDAGPKTFQGQTGNFDADDILGILVRNPATARYLTTKLFTWFVYDNSSKPGALEVVAYGGKVSQTIVNEAIWRQMERMAEL